jgi:hypothetical protein
LVRDRLTQREEPYEVILHVRICAGAAGNGGPYQDHLTNTQISRKHDNGSSQSSFFFTQPHTGNSVHGIDAWKAEEEFTELPGNLCWTQQDCRSAYDCILIETDKCSKNRKLSDFPADAFSVLLRATPDQRERDDCGMYKGMQRSAVVGEINVCGAGQSDVLQEDKYRAITTIADALYPNWTEGHGHYGMDLTKVEKRPLLVHPEKSTTANCAKACTGFTQESSGADGLRELPDQSKNLHNRNWPERMG